MGIRKFPNRGEIYLVRLDSTLGSEINKTRPALIISNDINNQLAQTVTVIPITSGTEKIYPLLGIYIYIPLSIRSTYRL